MRNTPRHPRFRGLQDEQGSSLIETALLVPVLLILVAGMVDYGRIYSVQIEVSSAAEAGALYGTQNTTDTAGMVKAATLDAPEVSSITPVATYGCECSDGTSASVSCASVPSCTYNVVNYVEVDTSATYTPLIIFPWIPSQITLTAKARMRNGH